MDIIILGLIKVVDNIVTTAKNITTYQNKKLITSILVILSQFLFYFVIKSVVNDESIISISIVCICSGIGTYIAMLINERFKRDVVYTNILTCTCTDSIDELCDYLLEHNIKYIPDGCGNIKCRYNLQAAYGIALVHESNPAGP